MNKLRNTVGEIGELKWIPDGFHFLGPKESSERRGLMDIIYEFFTKSGYSEVVPPSFDFASSFSSHLSEKEKTHLLKYRDNSGSEISPSFDLTVQVVKGMAGFTHVLENQDVFYSGKVFKDYLQKNGMKREVFQVGAELIGKSDPKAFIKLILELERLFQRIGLKQRVTLVLGNTFAFGKIASFLNFSEKDKERCTSFIYSKDITSLEVFLNEKNVHTDIQDFLKLILLCFEFPILHKKMLSISKTYGLGLEKLAEDTESIMSAMNSKDRIFDYCLDFSLVRDLNYYTGFVFHGYAGSSSDPLFMGGAYDHLYERFSGVQKNACGFAINIDVLENLLRDL